MKDELGGEKKKQTTNKKTRNKTKKNNPVLVSACSRLVQRVKFMFGVASAQHMVTLVPFGNARNLSTQVLD